MKLQQRNNITVHGDGPATMLFAHGFGCDQTMWRNLTPSFGARYRLILFDLVGSGKSDLSAYDYRKYSTLHGYADDVLEIADQFAVGPLIFVGHSVSAIIGMLAAIKEPHRFAANLMVGPSPSYINDGDYIGGFSRGDIEGLLQALESNYLGWSSNMAPAIMGAPHKPELGVELTNSFCRTNPDIAKHFARVTFTADHRKDLPLVTTPSLIVQCSEDSIAPRPVGEFMHKAIRHSSLRVVENVGHCPHLSSPGSTFDAMRGFLTELDL
ncbi:MAG: alpha/beta hydrolase [Archangium sp.]|nr:alpha/beta hydrolase [Archangium sp.]